MRPEKEIMNELKRVKRAKDEARGDEKTSLISRYWTLKWVLEDKK